MIHQFGSSINVGGGGDGGLVLDVDATGERGITLLLAKGLGGCDGVTVAGLGLVAPSLTGFEF
jgi:hypothetical protein